MQHRTRVLDLGHTGFAASCSCTWTSLPVHDRKTARQAGDRHVFDAAAQRDLPLQPTPKAKK